MIRRVPQSVFFAYRDAPERRAALREPVGSADRYRLLGPDEVARGGVATRHNLEREEVPAWARRLDAAVNRPLYAVGGHGGDFASVVGSLGPINRSDVVFSTVDTVGIPLALLRAAR